jgi:hypothetical protein
MTEYQIGYAEVDSEGITSRYGGTWDEAFEGAREDSRADHVSSAWIRAWETGGGLGPILALFVNGVEARDKDRKIGKGVAVGMEIGLRLDTRITEIRERPELRRHRITVRLDNGLKGYDVVQILEQDGMLTPSGRLGAGTRRVIEAWLEEPGVSIIMEEVPPLTEEARGMWR